MQKNKIYCHSILMLISSFLPLVICACSEKPVTGVTNNPVAIVTSSASQETVLKVPPATSTPDKSNLTTNITPSVEVTHTSSTVEGQEDKQGNSNDSIVHSATGSADSSKNEGTSTCNIAKLNIILRFENGATGWNLGHIYFTNNGLVACMIGGFPELELLDNKGQPSTNFIFSKVKLLISDNEGSGPDSASRISLQPGSTAAAVVELYRCDLGFIPGTSLELKVGLPNQSEKVVIDNKLQVCRNLRDMRVGVIRLAHDNWKTLP